MLIKLIFLRILFIYILEILSKDSVKYGDVYEAISCFDWFIDNKYYQAKVCLSGVRHGTDIPEAMLCSAEAIIAYFDPFKVSL